MLMLANERRVDLQAPVASVMPGYPHAGTRVRHLLAHSASLNDYDWFDATLRFSAAPDGSVTMALDSVYVVAPAAARRGP